MSESFRQNEIITENINKEWEYENIDDDELLRRYECPICLDILIDPILHSACGNMFCRRCIGLLSSCPLCRKTILESDLTPVPNVTKDLIAKLKVKCNHCGQEMTLEASKTHKMKCEFPCPFECGN